MKERAVFVSFDRAVLAGGNYKNSRKNVRKCDVRTETERGEIKGYSVVARSKTGGHYLTEQDVTSYNL